MRKKSRFIVAICLTAAILCLCLTACGGVLSAHDALLRNDLPEGYVLYSFNIRLDTALEWGTRWSDRREQVAAYIDGSGADVLCLQEVKISQYEYLRDNLTNYSVVWYGRDSSADTEGLAVLYTDEFEVERQTRFWLSETPDVQSVGWDAQYPRICVNVLLRHESGDMLNVFNVHLDHIGDTSRTEGIKLVTERAESDGYPAVIAGDFNSGLSTDCYAAISEKFDDAKNAADSEGGYTYSNWGMMTEGGDPIDHIFLSRDLTADVYRVLYEFYGDGEYYSDHFAVGVRFRTA